MVQNNIYNLRYKLENLKNTNLLFGIRYGKYNDTKCENCKVMLYIMTAIIY